jgi:hypothetical protein
MLEGSAVELRLWRLPSGLDVDGGNDRADLEEVLRRHLLG